MIEILKSIFEEKIIFFLSIFLSGVFFYGKYKFHKGKKEEQIENKIENDKKRNEFRQKFFENKKYIQGLSDAALRGILRKRKK